MSCNTEIRSAQHYCESFSAFHCIDVVFDVNGMVLGDQTQAARRAGVERNSNGVHCASSCALNPSEHSPTWLLPLSTEMPGIMRHLVAFWNLNAICILSTVTASSLKMDPLGFGGWCILHSGGRSQPLTEVVGDRHRVSRPTARIQNEQPWHKIGQFTSHRSLETFNCKMGLGIT